MALPPEPWIERKIREAAEAGEFDDLEGSGEPIPDIDESYDPAWWARRWVERNRRLQETIEAARNTLRGD